ncbi:hypothetical protein ACXR6G_03895 [Ancylomarina sp. YFZ004]
MKYIKSPDFYLKGMKYAHILKGTYVKPELAFSSYSYDRNYFGYNSSSNNRVTNWAAAFNIIVGKQYVFNDLFLLDMYFGLGYGFSKDNEEDSFLNNNSDESYHYGFSGGNSDTPLTVTAGLKIGILLK